MLKVRAAWGRWPEGPAYLLSTAMLLYLADGFKPRHGRDDCRLPSGKWELGEE